jgi:membrane associated rhomboid family serine protease
MIIPIGHEQNVVSRHPWVTYGIMILCVALFLLTHFAHQARVRQSVELLSEAVEYHLEHPYLQLDPRLQAIVWGDEPGAAGQALRAPGEKNGRGTPDGQFSALEQVELDGLTQTGFDALAATPLYRWGLVPADFSVVGLLTHMFLHVGWLHLLGNLLFLYLSAPFLEDAWGPRFFAGFYLASGIVAGSFFALRYPGLDAPLVGASGAVAGVMGTFMICHWNRKIRFCYWFGMGFRGTFSSPAWVILPLWFLRELLAAQIMDRVAPGSGGGVAYWAHVSGFGFGAVLAAGLRLSGWEGKILAAQRDDELTVLDNRNLDRAVENRARGKTDEAWALLAKEVGRNPGNADAVWALWEVAVETGRAREAAPSLLHLLRQEVRREEAVAACTHWNALVRQVPNAPLPAGLEARLAELLHQQGHRQEFAEVLAAVAGRSTTTRAPAGALLRLARLVPAGEAARLAALALTGGEVPPEMRRELERFAGGTGDQGRPPVPGSVHPRPGGDCPAPPALQVLGGIPLGLGKGQLTLRMDQGGDKVLPLCRIQAVAAASVDAGGAQPNLVVDLVLRAAGNGASLRSVRLERWRFDSRSLVPGEKDPEDAFVSLVGSILAGSGARWLLGGAATRLRSFPSLAKYQEALLGAVFSADG